MKKRLIVKGLMQIFSRNTCAEFLRALFKPLHLICTGVTMYLQRLKQSILLENLPSQKLEMELK